MNPNQYMYLIKGEIKTSEIRSCVYNRTTKKMDVTYRSGQMYSYTYDNVTILKDPSVVNLENRRVTTKKGTRLNQIDSILMFSSPACNYYHVTFQNGSTADYKSNDLIFEESVLEDRKSTDVWSYLQKIAGISELRDENGNAILAEIFGKLNFVSEDSVLANYLAGTNPKTDANKPYLIFPFGCNASQYQAVLNAMTNKVSIIEGPPGTGKTQTILNIIANILLRGETVEIVSNNNSATANVYEKLASDAYGLGFIVASLGSHSNKKEFLEHQSAEYPDFTGWEYAGNRGQLLVEIRDQSKQLDQLFHLQEQEARIRQEQAELDTEIQYFNQYIAEKQIQLKTIKGIRHSNDISAWIAELEQDAEKNRRITFRQRLHYHLKYNVSLFAPYKAGFQTIIDSAKNQYYACRVAELKRQRDNVEKRIRSIDPHLMETVRKSSMVMLKDQLAMRYHQGRRVQFTEEDVWRNPQKILQEYPVVLSTTFSSATSLKNVTYDYVIMDEASQVDIVTGALAMYSAKNAVIVGDTKQLPNVVTEENQKRADTIFSSRQIAEGYRFQYSFLQSVIQMIPDLQRTLLAEHYRCHPKIIQFCNQMFYGNHLLIMTQDQGEQDVLSVIRTPVGNHCRGHLNQREIDVVKQEVLPNLSDGLETIGIIAPYNQQVDALKAVVPPEIDVATVHKFQGREKNHIILSTVDDHIGTFADDPNLLNVAVSRAKRQLVVVTSGNEQPESKYVKALVDYIRYQNFEVKESQVYSVFDYLYKPNAEARMQYLKDHKNISEYDSENLMYALITDELKEAEDSHLGCLVRYPLRMLFRDLTKISLEEQQYLLNAGTHIDFLIYHKVSKQPVLAIEVDGTAFHQEGSRQAERDKLKNHILEVYGLPLLRFKTNGSGEKELLREKLMQIDA